MENTTATTSLFLDTRREKKNNTYPVKLTIYFEGEKRRYKTGIDLTEKQWEKLGASNLRDDDLRTIKRKLNIKKEKADAIIEKMDTFSFEEFESDFFQEKKVRQSSELKALFDEYIEQLHNTGRVGTASIYQTTINCLLDFRPKLLVRHITKEFLEQFEQYMLEKNHSLTTNKLTEKARKRLMERPVKKISPTTVGIYMRHLRTIINIAITRKLLPADRYPFKGYAIPSSRNTKKALQATHIKSLLNYQSDNEEKQRAVDFWLFSYISNGINFTDICKLKPEDIQGEFFSFYRAKTINTKKRDARPIRVPLTPETKRIIEKWRNTDPTSPYLFPILCKGLDPRQQKFRIQDFIWKVNRSMNLVATEIGFEGKIGTYVARHSHSTILKRSGASTEMIKENLGHASVLTTENYLDDFEDDVKIEYAKKLTDL